MLFLDNIQTEIKSFARDQIKTRNQPKFFKILQENRDMRGISAKKTPLVYE